MQEIVFDFPLVLGDLKNGYYFWWILALTFRNSGALFWRIKSWRFLAISVAPQKLLEIWNTNWPDTTGISWEIGEEACKDWKGTCITATSNQTIEADGSWNSLATMTWWLQTHLAPTKHPGKSPVTAQAERHTTKLTTSWWRNDSKQVWTLPRPEASQEPILEATMSWSCWPSSYIWRGRGKKTMQHKDQIWSRKAEGPWSCRDLPSKDRREVCSTLHPRL